MWGLKGIGTVIETERGGARFLVSCPKMDHQLGGKQPMFHLYLHTKVPMPGKREECCGCG